jgi:hypothetical protein
MDRSIHDNIIYGYTVISGTYGTPFYTITLYTEYYHTDPTEYTDIRFTNVIAHHFERELPNSVILYHDTLDIEHIYQDNRTLFERLKNYGWPCDYDTPEMLIISLKEKNLKAFTISSSLGLEGWVWAESMDILVREQRKQFE